MNSFVHARVEENRPDAVYDDFVFTRYLVLSCPNGQVLKVFDASDMGEKLVVGEEYNFVLSVDLFSGLTNSLLPSREAAYQAQIVDLHWTPPPNAFSMSSWRLNEDAGRNTRSWLVVKTSFGQLLMHKHAIEHSLRVKIREHSWLEWQNARFWLLAII